MDLTPEAEQIFHQMGIIWIISNLQDQTLAGLLFNDAPIEKLTRHLQTVYTGDKLVAAVSGTAFLAAILKQALLKEDTS